MKIFPHRRRPAHFGPFPLETLKRAETVPEADRPARPPRLGAPLRGLSGHILSYLRLFEQAADDEIARKPAPLPEDPQLLANELKAACYFLDASMVGTCRADASAWYLRDDDGARLTPYHGHAVVILVEHPDDAKAGTLAARWLTADAAADCAAFRAAEIALIVAGYVRRLGFAARAHTRNGSDVDAEALAVRAGLAIPERGGAVNPFLGRRFAVAVVTTDLKLAEDAPLARQVFASAPQSRRDLDRASHHDEHRMEKLKHVERPATAAIESETAPKSDRARVARRARLATKYPFADAILQMTDLLVPLQQGPVADDVDPACGTSVENAAAIKSLGHFLGASLSGICMADEYAWYAREEGGRRIEPAHENAVVLLVEHRGDTVKNATTDNFLDDAQRMRSYFRSAQIAGLMAAHIRSLGFSARAHTFADSQVDHIALMQWAGLGEWSPVGERVLNPFMGSRFASAVVTTDMPLAADRPIEFGLPDVCANCEKCARQCPCDALSRDDTEIFIGFDIWKLDEANCPRRQGAEQYDAVCTRCMSVCPYNHEGRSAHDAVMWGAIKFPFLRRWIARLDDKVESGHRPAAPWWHDLETIDGVCVRPRKPLDPSKA